MPDINLSLPHNYEVEEIGDFPGAGKFRQPVIFFPRPIDGREGGGLWVKVHPHNAESWIGVSASQYQSPPTFSRVLSSPEPSRFCVISHGGAYIVKADDPEVWEEIPIMPVLDVRLTPKRDLLIFSDFSRLAAHDGSRVVWKNSDICSDDLKITKITDETIEGAGYYPANPIAPEMRFVVDLKTGALLSPPSRNAGQK
jgi:hypothetical protein